MAPRTDRTTRIPSSVASPVTTDHVRVCQPKDWWQLENIAHLVSGFATCVEAARAGGGDRAPLDRGVPLALQRHSHQPTKYEGQ